MSAIKPLPELVARQVSSSAVITTLNEVVLGLLCNALDANASNVEINVDYSRASCSVEDDGVGIPVKELARDGKLGRPFHTSKYHQECDDHVYGFQGTFLSSLSTISILKITSRQRHDAKLGQLLLIQGERLASSSDFEYVDEVLKSRLHGSKVSVQNLFGEMPVRVKQRPIGDEGRRRREFSLRKLIHDLSSYALAWYADVQITLRSDGHTHKWRDRGTWTPSPDQSRNRHSIDDLDPSRLCNILIQVNPGITTWNNWVQMSARGTSIRVQGLMSKIPSADRTCQFISLGIYPLQTDNIHGVLFEAVNSLIASSTFASASSTWKSWDNKVGLNDGLPENLPPESKRANALEKYAMFYIRIHYDKASDIPRSRLGAVDSNGLVEIKAVIEAMIIGFLENQGYRRHSRSASKGVKRLEGPHEEPVQLLGDAFTDRTHMKSGVSARKVQKLSPSEARSIGADFENSQSLSKSSRNPSEATDDGPTKKLCQDLESNLLNSKKPFIKWHDDRSGDSHWINSRTGMVEVLPADAEPNSSVTDANSSRQQRGNRITIPVDGSQHFDPDNTAREWVDGLVDAWQNPVFEVAETPIPSAIVNERLLEQMDIGPWNEFCVPDHYDLAFQEFSRLSDSRISREQLADAVFISQVDAKYLLASVPGLRDDAHTERPLILIDQHAADERIRVESLFSQLCGMPESLKQSEKGKEGGCDANRGRPDIVTLDPPITFNVTVSDEKLLREDASFFRRWGISYSFRTTADDQACRSLKSHYRDSPGSVILSIHGLPSVIAERCRLNPEILRSMLIEEARTRDESALTGQSADLLKNHVAKASTKHWMTLIQDCPRGIVDMLNSRACRSAVMFNDSLSDNECQELLRKLSKTALPFQCAHGRPSMIPLAGVERFRPSEGQGPTFAEAWNAWMQINVTNSTPHPMDLD